MPASSVACWRRWIRWIHRNYKRIELGARTLQKHRCRAKWLTSHCEISIPPLTVIETIPHLTDGQPKYHTSPHINIKQVCPMAPLHITKRGSAVAETPAQRSVSAEILIYCCTNNANGSRVSLRSTFSNYHFRIIKRVRGLSCSVVDVILRLAVWVKFYLT